MKPPAIVAAKDCLSPQCHDGLRGYDSGAADDHLFHTHTKKTKLCGGETEKEMKRIDNIES